MNEFIKIKANNQSLGQRKPVFGVGVNDAWYMTQPTVNNKQITCHTYMKWKQMIQRCYSEASLIKHKTYVGCSVCDEWLSFSSFAVWYEKNDVFGYELDKDLKVKGNKLYSPDTCLLVPHDINSLFINCMDNHNKMPVEFGFHNQSGRYQARISIGKKQVHIGIFSTPEEAWIKYKKAKNKEITRKAEKHPEFATYLLNHINKEFEE